MRVPYHLNTSQLLIIQGIDVRRSSMFETLLVLTLLYTSLPERCDAQCPTTLPPTIVKSACSTQTELDAIKSQIATQVASMIDNSLSGCILPIGSSQVKPATTCQQVLLAYPSSISGYFTAWKLAPHSSAPHSNVIRLFYNQKVRVRLLTRAAL